MWSQGSCKGKQEGGSQQRWEQEAGVVQGRGHEPRSAIWLSDAAKARKAIFPEASIRNSALLTPRFLTSGL